MHRMTLRLTLLLCIWSTALAGKAADTDQWLIDSGTGAKLWNPAPVEGESVEWQGADHEATGAGVTIWRINGIETEQAAGTWKTGKLEGYAVWKHSSGARYEGQWKNGRKHGYGVYTWANGRRFCGRYRDGKRQEGAFFLADGTSAGSRKTSNEERQLAFEAEAAAMRARQAAGDARRQASRLAR